jgi:Mg2+ and Co2+ transporter CorA
MSESDNSASIFQIAYREDLYGHTIIKTEDFVSSLEAIKAKKDINFWINVNNYDSDIINYLCNSLDIHPLTREDLSNNNLRPKIEDGDEYLFVTLKMIYLMRDKKTVVQEQVNFILGDNFLVSFQEKPGDIFGIIRNRLTSCEMAVDFTPNSGGTLQAMAHVLYNYTKH